MCLHTADALAGAGKCVLVVDLDQRGNLSSVFPKNIHALQRTVADVLLNGAKTLDVIEKTSRVGLLVVRERSEVKNVGESVCLIIIHEYQMSGSTSSHTIQRNWDQIGATSRPSYIIHT